MRVLSLVTNGEARFYKQQLAGLRARGVEVDSMEIPGHRPEHTDNVENRSPRDYLEFYGSALRSSLDGYDLVHASYGLTAPPAVLQSRVPTVVTLWGSDLMGTFAPVSKLCARRADEVVVMSTAMAEALGQPCTVLPHGVDADRFEPMAREAARDELGWDVEGHLVLFPYESDRPIKNYPRAERVVAAAERRLDAPVELRTVTGVSHERMPLYHNAADALFLTSHREGSPNSVKEAMACNVPVVATDVGDVAERLRDVDPSVVGRTDEELVDGLLEVLERGERSNGRTMAAPVSLDAQVDRLQSLYERAIGD